jgi:hypothetical protein
MGLADEIRRQGVVPEWRRRPEVLLSPPIPKPMHGLAPRVVLGQEWWDETRRAAYASTFYHCIACGISKHDTETKRLEAHEIYDVDWLLGRMVYLETVPLCQRCHNFIHSGRLEQLRESGEITGAEYSITLRRGNKVLREAGLLRQTYTGPVAAWQDWRLVIGDDEWEPIFKSEADWARVYDR